MLGTNKAIVMGNVCDITLGHIWIFSLTGMLTLNYLRSHMAVFFLLFRISIFLGMRYQMKMLMLMFSLHKLQITSDKYPTA
jgi:hypothetical protein